MNSVTLELGDQRVRTALGAERGGVVQLAGDPSTGVLATTPLDSGKCEVVVVYRGNRASGAWGMFMTLDVYAVPGEPLVVHLICPRCHKPCTVDGSRKQIDFDPRAVNPLAGQIRAAKDPALALIADLGRISIAPFECTWELGDDKHVRGGVHTGVSLCRMRLGISDNRALDA